MRGLLAALLIVVFSSCAFANPAVVQYVNARPGGSSASATTAATATTTGNTFVAVITAFTNIIGGTPMTDSASNTWSQAVASTGTTEGWVAIFYVSNATGSATHTFTFTPTANGFLSVTVFEISGLATSSALDATDADSSTGTVTKTTGPITATGICEIFIGGMGVSETGSGMMLNQPAWYYDRVVSDGTHQGLLWGWRYIASGGSDSFTAEAVATDRETAAMAGFKSASACTTPVSVGRTSSVFVN